MITDKDIQKILLAFVPVFATKQDLEQFVTKSDLEGEIDSLKSSVFTRMDAVYKEVVDMRQEQSAHFQQHEDNEETLKNHESRLHKIESLPLIAHQIKK